MTRMIRDMIGVVLMWMIAKCINWLEVVAPWKLDESLAVDFEDFAHACD